MTTDTTHPTDVIDTLLGEAIAAEVAPLRDLRPITRAEAQASHDALFGADSPGASQLDKLLIAVFVTLLHGDEVAAEFYANAVLALDAGSEKLQPIRQAALGAATTGPYGDFPSAQLSSENLDGPEYRAPEELVVRVGRRLASGLEYAHFLIFHPRDAHPERISALLAAGWDENGVVTLAQEVAFLAFQVRVVAGLAALAGQPRGFRQPVPVVRDSGTRLSSATPTDDPRAATGERPTVFTSANLDWLSWVEPVAEADLTPAQITALVDASRAKNPYFRLLARDPGILEHRTKTDKDIFYNTATGIPRAERELAATATSRFNGCLYCASVHSRFAEHYSKRGDEVALLLSQGVQAITEPRWRAIIESAVALSRTPIRFGLAQVASLRAIEFTDDDIADVVQASAFFNWANRLMLSLGEPACPSPTDA